jgi:CRP-like cAMP-binding protein
MKKGCLNFSIFIQNITMPKPLGNINNDKGPDIIPFSYLLTDEQILLLSQNLNQVHYRKKDIIFRQNTRASNLMFVKSGLVKIFKEGRNDRTIILKLESKGNFIGLMSVFGENIHQYSASAVDDAEICDIDFSVFKSVLMENGKFAIKFLSILSTDGLFIFDRLLSLSHKQLPGRIAEVLLYFSENIYMHSNFTIPFTRKELAEFAGTTKESFIRTLTEFKNDKIISIDGSNIMINSIDIIRTLSALG